MLKVLKSGFYTTIQDSGRIGYRSFGVPVSGVMDSYSCQFANAILGNQPESAVLEITMTGPVLQFQEPTQIAIAGADLVPKLNDEAISNNQVVNINIGDIIRFSGFKSGFRCYMAIKGGFRTEAILGSSSMYKGVTENERIKKDDVLSYLKQPYTYNKTNSKLKFDSSIINTITLHVTKGPEYDKLSIDIKDKLEKLQFEVSRHNSRMAYQLKPVLANDLKPIITSPVLPGTVQLTPAGNLIVLMRDCQTTGGYPRILQLTERSLNILSQKRQGDELSFRLNA